MEKYENLNDKLNKCFVSGDELLTMLTSESVYTLLRMGIKSPDRSGVSNCDDDQYVDLYNMVNTLRNYL